ncbi:MAG TPA: response regulator, partial [Gemmatimonadaceae bacterium]
MNVTDQPILLVEDDENDVMLLQRAFRRAAIVNPLQVVRHGDDAVAYLEGTGEFADRRLHPLPVLMLLDLKLPRRTGLEVLQWVKERSGVKKIPIIVLTSSKN